MHKNSLLEILRTFTQEELKRFDDFVSSPYFNKKSFVTALFKHIKKYSPEFNSSRLEREKVWKALYPDKEYNYGIFKNLVFDLTKLAERFISLEATLLNEAGTEFNLLNASCDRKLPGLFKTYYNITDKALKNSYKNKKLNAETYFYFMYKTQLLKFYHNLEYESNPKIFDELEKHCEYLVSNILIMLLRSYTNVISFSKDYDFDIDKNIVSVFLKKSDSSGLLEDIAILLKNRSGEIYDVINVYYKVFNTHLGGYKLDDFLELKKTLNEYSKRLSKEDKQYIYINMIQILDKINDNHFNKPNEFVDIFKMRIKDNTILNEEGSLSPIAFISCIQNACTAGETRFIEEFTSGFQKYLPENIKDNLLKFSEAHLHFAKNEFSKSLEKILLVDYDLFIMKYYLKNLQMMNFYELNDYESFLSSLDAFKHFLSKNKSVTERWKSNQALFAGYLNRLFKLKEKSDGHELKNLKNEIINSNPHKKQWLLRKADEIHIFKK